MPSASKSCLSEHVDRFYPGSIQDGPGITDEWGQRSRTSWLSGTVRVPDSWRAPVVIPNVQGEAETAKKRDRQIQADVGIIQDHTHLRLDPTQSHSSAEGHPQ